MTYGGIEAGGTKWVCAIGDGPDDLRELATIPTTTPAETLDAAASFFQQNGKIAGIGVGSFGPIDYERGAITTTPKPGWANTDVVGALRSALDVPVAFDTDVNAAALGEQRWGAAVGLSTFSYVTVGTGIGGGGMANGRLMHGLLHPEFGHIRIPHDRARDPFEGVCPYHGDCFEGLASGESMRQRFGVPADELVDPDAWALEAEYIALGLVNVICTLSPQRIILGGGVMSAPGLLSLVHDRVPSLAGDYFDSPALREGIGEYVVRPALGDRAGVIGALELARARAAGQEATHELVR